MKVGLIDNDYSKFPNYALMKISAYHKSKGDKVEFASIDHYDIIYKSKIFSYSVDKPLGMISFDRIEYGGTGYDHTIKLPSYIDSLQPDYSLYGINDIAYGYLTRGCNNNCSWCIVPKKEGSLSQYMNIEDICTDRNKVILLDNNVLDCDHGLNQIEKIIKLKIKVDFNQGLDCRIIANNPDIAILLSKVKWLKPLRMACDNISQIHYIEKAVRLLRKYNCTPSRYTVYCLVKDLKDAHERVLFLDELNCDPFAQPFRDFNTGNIIDHNTAIFANWVNRKEIFRSIPFDQFDSRKR